ncbi:MAG: type II toxin-antitoxin system PemK/MazF family toxin [Flavobacteriales bacterium]|nr:type II toxin-antitoxin system PemK/MazF family toxin [Flavobacteriales bacterium]
MEAGSVIRWAFIQADGRLKLRPAVLIKAVPPFNDWVICAISSQVQRFQPQLDVLLDKTHPDFRNVGLDFPSIVRTAYLTTIPAQQVEGRIGSLSDATMAAIRSNLGRWLSVR